MDVDEIMQTDWNTINSRIALIEQDKSHLALMALETAMAVARAEAGGFTDEALIAYRTLKQVLLTDEDRDNIEAERAAERRRARAARAQNQPGGAGSRRVVPVNRTAPPPE